MSARADMRTMGGVARLVLVVMLWAGLGVYAVNTTRNFYRYIDHAIYLATDDSEASVAYSLATEGRYGFLSSPIIFVDTVRTNGPVNYGPWYFYVAAGFIWLFGFSLTLVRSIHFWIILGSVAAAAWWFKGRERASAAACFGLGILYCFETAQWPMARPDSFVSACALGCVICLGLALTRWRARYWFGAGLCAACGAFTHLIAWSLLPSSGLVLAFALALLWIERPSDMWRRAISGTVAYAAGAVLGVTSFYASFGFRLGEQLRFIRQYQQAIPSTDSYFTILRRHFDVAFRYLPDRIHESVWLLLAVSWLVIALSLRRSGRNRQMIHVYLVPPVALWTGYLLGNGFYTNYHGGYAILHQVLAWWTLAAMLWLALAWVRSRFPRVGSGVAAFVLLLLVGQTVRQLDWQLRGPSERLSRVTTWVGISDYAGRVLDTIPARSTAWGSLTFGIEVPSRIQLVQLSDALNLAPHAAASERAALTPDFLVLGYTENRDDVVSAFHGAGDSAWSHMVNALPGLRFRLVSIVSAPPYGTTRVFQRALTGPPGVPVVSAYDAKHQRWLSRLGEPVSTFQPVDAVTLRVGYGEEPGPATASRTVAADLPPGWYLVNVAVTPGAARSGARLIAATATSMLRQSMSELGPAGDFAAYTETDRELYLLLEHPGGPLSVSQFDAGAGAAFNRVSATPVVGLLDPALEVSHETPLPPLATWAPTSQVHVRPGPGGALGVDGDDTPFGYQIVSPIVHAARLDTLTVRIKVAVDRGNVCGGVLDGAGAHWLVAPEAIRDEMKFTADDSGGFRLVFANCNSQAQRMASRFSIETGTVVNDTAKLYVDQLVDAAQGLLRAPDDRSQLDFAGTPLDPDVRLVPPTLRVGRKDLARPLEDVRPETLTFRAPLVQYSDGAWTMKGKADGQYTYLLRSKERAFDADGLAVVTGRVERGGVTIGLFKKEQWVRQLNIETPGPFTVVLAPPSSGSYSLTIANDLPGGLDTSVSISKMGFLPSTR